MTPDVSPIPLPTFVVCPLPPPPRSTSHTGAKAVARGRWATEHPPASSPWEQWDNTHKPDDSSAVPVQMTPGTTRTQSPILQPEAEATIKLNLRHTKHFTAVIRQ